MTPAEIMAVSNFSAGPTAPGCDNSALANNTATEITGLLLYRYNGGGGTEEIYLCIEGVDGALSSQSYSSAQYGNWIIEAV